MKRYSISLEVHEIDDAGNVLAVEYAASWPYAAASVATAEAEYWRGEIDASYYGDEEADT